LKSGRVSHVSERSPFHVARSNPSCQALKRRRRCEDGNRHRLLSSPFFPLKLSPNSHPPHAPPARWPATLFLPFLSPPPPRPPSTHRMRPRRPWCRLRPSTSAILMASYVLGIRLALGIGVYLAHSLPALQPYQADTDNGIRGTQSGYNRCNSTTEGEKSMCQTAFINSIDGM
jgi:hypothetical protein